MDDKNIKRSIQLLCKAFSTLHTEEEFRAFLEDVCTIKELKSMAQRVQVAMLLDKGELYQSVEEKTGASSATISRVNRCLQYGEDGYRLVLDRLDNPPEAQ